MMVVGRQEVVVFVGMVVVSVRFGVARPYTWKNPKDRSLSERPPHVPGTEQPPWDRLDSYLGVAFCFGVSTEL